MRRRLIPQVSLVTPKFSDKKAGGYNQFEDAVIKDGTLTVEELLKNKWDKSTYDPDKDTQEMRTRIIKDFQIGMVNMWTPRVEFNDLSVIQRMQTDQMGWNTYQPNNGLPMQADVIQAWRSNAMRPIIRNKCISIAAHATARLIFPKIFANTPDNDDDKDAAQVMEDLMEWAADQSDYKKVALYRVITALTDPASIGYTEYAEVYRKVKRGKTGGKWNYEVLCDEILSGFQDYVVPCDELYIENFYEQDIQKQGFLIWRRVIPYSLAKAKYGSMYDNFDKYVKPGVQLLYSDANQSFYYVYDPNLRQNDVEEILYFNKSLDVKNIMVNGVMLTEFDNENPRLDKQYPLDKFGYEIINNRCFYYKSLAFKLMQDANIINTLYPMIIDGTYLQLFPPMVNIGSEVIGSDVIVPGAVTTLSDPNAKLNALQITGNIKAGFDALKTVEDSANDSSTSDLQSGQRSDGSTPTAYQLSREEQNAATVLGMFIQMIAMHVKSFGKLRLSDILQYLTIADASKIEGDTQLTFKTFLLHNKQSNNGSGTRKIAFDLNLPSEPQSPEDQLKASYDVLKEQGGPKSKLEIYKVNPELFRNLNFEVTVSPDVLNPKSEELERAYSLETYDRAIMNPVANQEAIFTDLLLATTPRTKKDPAKYVTKPQQQLPGIPPMQPKPLNQGQKPAGMSASGLPNTMPQATV